MIAVAFSIIKAFKGEQVDIITSSKVLAERDATNFEFKKVFQLFNFTVGHNCNENESERKIAYSSCNVIYGDLANFQRDFLLDTFYNRNILGGRRLENVLIDEVDSMLLDKGGEKVKYSVENKFIIISIFTRQQHFVLVTNDVEL